MSESIPIMVQKVGWTVLHAVPDSDIGPDEAMVIARLAIEAMREPTQAMMVAAFEADDTGDAMSLIRNEWQAMLTAALSPSREDEGK